MLGCLELIFLGVAIACMAAAVFEEAHERVSMTALIAVSCAVAIFAGVCDYAVPLFIVLNAAGACAVFTMCRFKG